MISSPNPLTLSQPSSPSPSNTDPPDGRLSTIRQEAASQRRPARLARGRAPRLARFDAHAPPVLLPETPAATAPPPAPPRPRRTPRPLLGRVRPAARVLPQTQQLSLLPFQAQEGRARLRLLRRRRGGPVARSCSTTPPLLSQQLLSFSSISLS